MRRYLRPGCAGLLLMGVGLFLTGCESIQYTDPGPEIYYANEVYPNEETYYYPQGHIYYWNEDNGWRAGPTPPPGRTYDTEHRKFLWFGKHKTETEREVQTTQKKEEVHVVHVEGKNHVIKHEDKGDHPGAKHHHWWRFW